MILAFDEVSLSPSNSTRTATRQRATKYGSMRIVWEACNVEVDRAIMAVPKVWRKLDLFLNIRATKTTFRTLITSVKSLADSIATLVPVEDARIAKGARKTVISGGWTRAKFR
jgi:hypothetical protein